MTDFSTSRLGKILEVKNKTTFHGYLNLGMIDLAGSPRFNRVDFLGTTTMPRIKFPTKRIDFRFCDMTGVLMCGLPDIKEPDSGEPCTVLESCEWARKKWLWFQDRHCVRDEQENDYSHRLLQVYRKLHSHYYSDSEFTLSGDFYVGFMTTNRKVRKRWLSKAIDVFYAFLSRYGQSFVRPLVALFLLWLLVPTVLLQLGVVIEEGSKTSVCEPILTLSFDNFRPHVDSFILLTSNFWKVVAINMSLSTLIRSSELRPDLASWQSVILLVETLLNGVLIAFIALGIRRTFSPKKPV